MKKLPWITYLMFFCAAYAWAGTMGDLDNNIEVDIADAVLALQVMSGISPEKKGHPDADVNGDSKIGLEEAIYILQTIAGLRREIIAPSEPKELSAIPGNAKVLLSWGEVSAATSYNVYWLASAGVTTANGNKISDIVEPSYRHSGLANGTKYYYVVTAYNGSTESGPSNEASAKPAAVLALKIIKMTVYNLEDGLMSYVTTEYDENGYISKTSIYPTGILSSYTVYENNASGKQTKYTLA